MSLMDRLSGKKPASNGTTANRPPCARISELAARMAAAAAPPAPPSTPLPATSPSARLTSSMYSRAERNATDKLSAVDQLKIDLHHRLIERLDLEALERIKDEAKSSTRFGNAVVEFLRAEPTPLSQTEREEIVEQIV